MANTKDVSFSVDFDALNDQLNAQREEEIRQESSFAVKSTVFTLGNDPRVGTKPNISTPDFYLIQILKDRMDNPYVKLHWKIPRLEVDSGGIIGFNIYRRDLKAEDAVSFNGIPVIDRVGFDKLARGNKKLGKFSAEQKALYNIKRKSIPLSILNPNLAILQSLNQKNAFQDVSPDSPSFTQGSFERFYKKFKKIGYVDYTAFSLAEKNKFLTVTDKNFAELSFNDKSVGFYETFAYYIEAVTKQLGVNPKSEVVIVTIEDANKVPLVESILAKQISETEIRLSIKMNPADKIARIFVYRKAEDEVAFKFLNVSNNVIDVINLIDEVKYKKTYTYRVFSQDVHGNLSEAKEITVFSSLQRSTPQTRSNSLKIPIISSVQDQNSDYVKITISPNDPLIAFYELKRRDLTIHERNFAVPSQIETNYGGTGWTANKFFVQKQLIPVDPSNPLKTKTIMNEIVFIDNTTDVGHLYEYRTRGYDLFGNPSSYAFSYVHTTGKKSIRTPINIKSEVLRGFPFRVKLSWDDDNLATPLSASQYKVQRRKLSETVYESFPLTVNRFLIDEVSCTDAVLFDGTPVTDTFTSQSNASANSNITVADSARRAYKMPPFLLQNDTYFYKITAIADNGEESNASTEFKVFTVPDLSDPVNFSVEVLNTKVSPITVRLTWDNEEEKEVPDRWVIERKIDTPYDIFRVVGYSYLVSEYFDVNVQPGHSYIYRIKSFDAIGRESAYFQKGLTL